MKDNPITPLTRVIKLFKEPIKRTVISSSVTEVWFSFDLNYSKIPKGITAYERIIPNVELLILYKFQYLRANV